MNMYVVLIYVRHEIYVEILLHQYLALILPCAHANLITRRVANAHCHSQLLKCLILLKHKLHLSPLCAFEPLHGGWSSLVSAIWGNLSGRRSAN